MKRCEMGGLNSPLRPMDWPIGSVEAGRSALGTPEARAHGKCQRLVATIWLHRPSRVVPSVRASLGIMAMGLGWLACTAAWSYPLFGVLDGVKSVVVTGCDPKDIKDWLEGPNVNWCTERILITTLTPEAASGKPTLMEDQNTHLLFLIDRSQSKFPEQWSHLFAGHPDLPDPTTLGPHDIMAAAIRRMPGGGFCYNIVVSAPDKTKLFTELGALVREDVGGGELPGARGKLRPPEKDISHYIRTDPVTVIHNLSEAAARRLMSSLQGDNKYTVNWKGLQEAATQVSALDATTEVYLIARKDAEIPEALRSRLPDDLSARKRAEQVYVRKDKATGGGFSTAMLAYWTEEHLLRAVQGGRSPLSALPADPGVDMLVDLGEYPRWAVAPVRNLATGIGGKEGESLAKQVAGEIVTGFTKLGLNVESQPDLEAVLGQLALDQLFKNGEALDTVKKMTRADALFVADLVSCNPETKPESEWSQLTTVPAELTTEPVAPNANARKFIIAGPYIYPKRDKDPQYLKDYADYRARKRVWDNDRQDFRVEWQETITATSTAECTVQCRLIGLREGPDYGKVVWSGTVKGEGTGREQTRGATVTVRGVDSGKPNSRAPEAEKRVPPSVLTATAQSAREALCRDLQMQAILDEGKPPEKDPVPPSPPVPDDGAQVANIDGNDVWLTLGAKCSAVEGDTFLIEVGNKQIPGPDGKPIREIPITVEAVVQQTYAAEEGKPPVAKCSPSVASDMIQVKQGQLATLRKGATQPPPLPPPPPVPPDGAAVDAVDENSVWLILGRDCAADIGDRFNVEVEGRQVTVTVQNVGKPGAEGNRRAQCAVLDPQERGLLRSGLPASLLPRIPLPPEKILVTVTVLLEEVRGQTPMAQKPKVGTVEQLDALQRAITGAQQEACKQIKERLKVTVSVEQVKGISKATGKHGWNPQTKTYNAIIRVEGTVEGEKTAEGESQ